MKPKRAVTAYTPGCGCSMRTRSAGSWRGERAISRFSSTIRSCATWLCSMLRNNALGTNCASLARNTAVPGTRCTVARMRGSSAIGTAKLRSAVRSRRRPLRQVMNTLNITIASSSGTHAPSANFARLASRYTRSTMNSVPNTSAICQVRQPHWERASSAPSSVVMPIVPATAAP